MQSRRTRRPISTNVVKANQTIDTNGTTEVIDTLRYDASYAIDAIDAINANDTLQGEATITMVRTDAIEATHRTDTSGGIRSRRPMRLSERCVRCH